MGKVKPCLRKAAVQITGSKKTKTLCTALLLVMSTVALWSFINTPFTGDIKVFFAAANQVKYQSSSGIMAVFESWELKGIANRLLMYLIYLPSDAIAGYGNKIAFELTAKVLYAAFIMLILFFSSYLLPAVKRVKRSAFFILFFSFFTVNSLIQLQAEMTGAALCFLCASLILCGKKPALVLSGFTGALLFFFKSIFILLYISAVLCAFICNFYFGRRANAKRYLISAASMLIFEIVFLTAVFLIYPQEFKDMSYASNFQSTLLSEGSDVSLNLIIDSLSSGFITSSVMIPMLLAGVLASVPVFIRLIAEKKYTIFAALLFSWIIPFDIIIVSNTYFAYHYFLLIIPCALSILLFIKEAEPSNIFILMCAAAAFLFTAGCWILKDGLKQIPIINNSTVLLVCIHLFVIAIIIYALKSSQAVKKGFIAAALTICLFFWINYSSVIAPYYRNIRALEKSAENINRSVLPEDFSDSSILYLDSGLIAFYSDAPSYSRYFFNLPMQRYSNGDSWECQKTEYELLLNYSGKYIVYSDWFGIDKYPELKKKLEEEYVRLENSVLSPYSPSWNVFSLEQIPGEDYNSGDTYILVRKQ